MSVNVGANPPDFSTLAGKVRVLVGDTNPSPLDPPVTGQGEYAWFSDDEIAALGDMFGSNPKKVAIWVLSQVSVSQALLLKKWTSEDLEVDGPAILTAMEKTIARLAREVAAEDVLTGDSEFFGVYENPNVQWARPGLRTPYPPNLPIDWGQV